MFNLGQEVEIEAIDKKASAMQSAAQLRDELFEDSQGKIIKIISGGVLGMYLIYRFLMK